MKPLGRLMLTGSAALAALWLLARQPSAEEWSGYGYYDHYDAGYAGAYDQNDWFFDYYAYEYDPRYCDYDYYTGYSYAADLFEWEEKGLIK